MAGSRPLRDKGTYESGELEARIVVQSDFTDEDDVDEFVDTTLEDFDRLDHLVTSVGGP